VEELAADFHLTALDDYLRRELLLTLTGTGRNPIRIETMASIILNNMLIKVFLKQLATKTLYYLDVGKL
jgi:hypothetical protein